MRLACRVSAELAQALADRFQELFLEGVNMSILMAFLASLLRVSPFFGPFHFKSLAVRPFLTGAGLLVSDVFLKIWR
jgi:hypothetical protein